ncbi:hypothetical protein [Falsiphaeobacter marinintestinus]|uniref:hypothetical protein n=1 Tax=Falsiphaeobacter marinintestinus TaxID=1492905 RepID=UPI0011B666F0|nr:hypothetical protein [Phaeobacter marinintestinus]
MAKTLKDLALALLNATLILVAVCLFLGWKLSSTVDGVLTGFASKIQIVGPMRDDVKMMTAELSALRSDLASLNTGDLSPEIMSRVQTRIDQVGVRMDKMGGRLDEITALPQTMLDQSIRTLGNEAAHTVNDIRGCVPPEGEV